MNKIERKYKVIRKIKPSKKVTYPTPPFLKWVKLDDGTIMKAYYDDKLKEPKRVEFNDDGSFDIFYTLYSDDGESSIYCSGKVIATANTKKELK